MAQDAREPGYRWVIVTASALILALSMGAIVNGMSAFIVPMEQAYGWPRGEIALINLSGLMGLAFGGFFIGPLADRHGTRPVVVAGVLALGAGYLLASFATALWQIYPIMFGAGFFGAGAIFSPVMANVGNWFRAGAGTAIGIASAGQALGQGGVPFASAALIEAFGIQPAFAILGAAMLALLLPLAALLRPPPQLSAAQRAAEAIEEQALLPTRRVVLMMSAAILLCCTCMSVPLMHLVPLVQDRGFPLEAASSVIFVMLLVAILGRIAFGRLADMIGALPAYMTATAWMTVMVFGFTQIGSLNGFYGYAVVYGFGYAGVMTGVLVTIRALTPRDQRAAATGIVIMFGWFGHAIGGAAGGFLHDVTGTYSAAYALAALSGAANLVVVGSLWRMTGGPRRLAAQA